LGWSKTYQESGAPRRTWERDDKKSIWTVQGARDHSRKLGGGEIPWETRTEKMSLPGLASNIFKDRKRSSPQKKKIRKETESSPKRGHALIPLEKIKEMRENSRRQKKKGRQKRAKGERGYEGSSGTRRIERWKSSGEAKKLHGL